MTEKEFEYKKLFERNYGIFQEKEQEKIKQGKVAIIGCGGAGGAITLALARSGVEEFILADPDTYEVTNINRQISCRANTLGENKATATKEDILKINPSAEVETYQDPQIEDIKNIIGKDPDVLVGVADDFPFAIIAMRKALENGISCVTSYPTGALVRVTTFLPEGPEPEEAFGIPKGLSYETLENIMFSTKYRKRFRNTLEFYKDEGEWTQEWFDKFIEQKYPLPQITPFVWLGSSLGALEVLKLLSDRWEPIASPKHWRIKANSAEIAEFDPPSLKEKIGSLALKLKEKL
ncbi:hypothetical protein C9439_05815 [archaeon SCG-AAA382B04]|nr:hypothetical protein C9439_05815 [archaeon SCG-AAA382B04]